MCWSQNALQLQSPTRWHSGKTLFWFHHPRGKQITWDMPVIYIITNIGNMAAQTLHFTCVSDSCDVNLLTAAEKCQQTWKKLVSIFESLKTWAAFSFAALCIWSAISCYRWHECSCLKCTGTNQNSWDLVCTEVSFCGAISFCGVVW